MYLFSNVVYTIPDILSMFFPCFLYQWRKPTSFFRNISNVNILVRRECETSSSTMVSQYYCGWNGIPTFFILFSWMVFQVMYVSSLLLERSSTYYEMYTDSFYLKHFLVSSSLDFPRVTSTWRWRTEINLPFRFRVVNLINVSFSHRSRVVLSTV